MYFEGLRKTYEVRLANEVLFFFFKVHILEDVLIYQMLFDTLVPQFY